MSQYYGAPAWPDWDTIARSLNNRNNLYGNMRDDPLFGVTITEEMTSRAHKAAFAPKV